MSAATSAKPISSSIRRAIARGKAARQLAVELLERGGEIGRVVVAHLVGHFRDSIIAVQQQIRRALHAAFGDVAVDGELRDLTKARLKLGLIQADHARQFRNLRRVSVVLRQVVARLVDAIDIAWANTGRRTVHHRPIAELTDDLQEDLGAQCLQVPPAQGRHHFVTRLDHQLNGVHEAGIERQPLILGFRAARK
jgi:hypothetical protein